jgi:hypothetical protein
VPVNKMTDIEKLRNVLDIFDIYYEERKVSIISCGRKYTYNEAGEITKVVELNHKSKKAIA